MLQASLPSKEKLITSNIGFKARQAAIALEKERFLEYGMRVSNEQIEKRLAEQKFTMAILATLWLAGITYRWRDKLSGVWFKAQKNRLEVVSRANGLYWQNGRKHRRLIYNLAVPLVKNNVDLCLFDAPPANLDERNSKSYIGRIEGPHWPRRRR